MPSANRKSLLVLLAALFLSLLTVSIVNVTLPSIERGLGASEPALQWVLSGYALAFGLVLVGAGRAGDMMGRERLFVLGVAVFTLGAVLAAAAPTSLVLNGARIVMGVGAGIFNPQISGLIQQYYQGAERARAFGLFGGTVGLASAIGPLVGGLLLASLPETLGWRATLGLNIPVGVAVVVLARLWLPRSSGSRPDRADFDPFGAGLLGAAVVCLMLPFMLAGDRPVTWVLEPVGVALALGWFAWERSYAARGREPMVDLDLFRIGTFSRGSLMIAVFFCGTTSVWVLQAQFVQQGMGGTALQAGLISLPASLLLAVSAQIAGRMVMRIGRWIVVAGLVFSILGLVAAVAVTEPVADGRVGLWALAASLALIGFGNGMVTSPNQALTLAEVPVEHGGTAGGVMQTGQRIGTAMGAAAVTGLYFHHLPSGAAHAFRLGYGLVIGVFCATLAIALADALARRTDRPMSSTRPSPARM